MSAGGHVTDGCKIIAGGRRDSGGERVRQTYRDVAALVARMEVDDLRAIWTRRASVDHARIVNALATYYGPPDGGHGLYSARLAAGEPLTTSILTRLDWIDHSVSLDAERDRLPIDEGAADRAAQRLAATLTLGTRMVNMPLYRLLSVHLGEGTIAGTLGLTHFTRYALTMDLLEAELVDSLATGAAIPCGMPICLIWRRFWICRAGCVRVGRWRCVRSRGRRRGSVVLRTTSCWCRNRPEVW